MSAELYLTFVAATVALIAIPGPNVALIVANSVAHGRRYGLLTVGGTTAAMVPQLGLVALGTAGTLTLLGHVFEWVRWLGVAYLILLAVQAWRAPVVVLTNVAPEPRSAKGIFLRGFLVSSTNPKTLLFYGAFFPQFISPDANVGIQLALLSMTFLLLATALDSCWAFLGARFRGVLAPHGRSRNRLTASFYLAAAVGLASARRPA